MGRDRFVQQVVDRSPRHDEIVEDGVVRENKSTDGVPFPVQFQLSGGRPDAAFQAVATHSPPGPDGTLGKISLAVGQCSENVFFGDVKTPDVVQAAVVALADHRVHAAGGLADVGVAGQHVLHQRRLHGANTQRIGEQNRRFQRAQFIDLDKAGGLAEAVDNIACRQEFVVEDISLMGQQSRHAGLDVSLRQRAVSHRHPRHIADLIQGAVGQPPHREPPLVSCNSHAASS